MGPPDTLRLTVGKTRESDDDWPCIVQLSQELCHGFAWFVHHLEYHDYAVAWHNLQRKDKQSRSRVLFVKHICTHSSLLMLNTVWYHDEFKIIINYLSAVYQQHYTEDFERHD